MRSDLTICKQNNYLHEKQHLCIKYIFCESVPHFAGRIKVKMLHGWFLMQWEREGLLIPVKSTFELSPCDLLSMDLKKSWLATHYFFQCCFVSS